MHRHAVGVGDDSDAQVIFLWIAFNAAYAKQFGFETTERDVFGKFIATLLLKGCYVFSTDPETQDYFSQRSRR